MPVPVPTTTPGVDENGVMSANRAVLARGVSFDRTVTQDRAWPSASASGIVRMCWYSSASSVLLSDFKTQNAIRNMIQ